MGPNIQGVLKLNCGGSISFGIRALALDQVFIVYRLRSLNLNSCVFLFFSNSFFFFFVPCSLSLFVDLVLVSLIQSVVLQFVVEVIKKKNSNLKKKKKIRNLEVKVKKRI